MIAISGNSSVKLIRYRHAINERARSHFSSDDIAAGGNGTVATRLM